MHLLPFAGLSFFGKPTMAYENTMPQFTAASRISYI